jgi:hypothetical protein
MARFTPPAVTPPRTWSEPLPLTLLVPGVLLADHHHDAVTPDDLAVLADLLD